MPEYVEITEMTFHTPGELVDIAECQERLNATRRDRIMFFTEHPEMHDAPVSKRLRRRLAWQRRQQDVRERIARRIAPWLD